MQLLPSLLLLITTPKVFLGLAACKNREVKGSNNSGTDVKYCGKSEKTCEESKYRSYDGSCNNLKHPWWGTPFTPYMRVLPCNSYADGVSKLPERLPNPRTLSLRIYADLEKRDELWTLAFMQYGQIVTHDMALTAGVAQTKKDAVVCCSKGNITKEGKTDPRCAPILLPEDDPYNAPEGITCMDFYRTKNTKDEKCTNETEVAEQLTAVTAFLDVSYIYGSGETTAKSVRKFKGGRLLSVTRNGKEFLPQDPTPTQTCNVKNASEPCYLAGDVRVNQNPQLALLHNIHLVQHNSIADDLAKLNPHWDDERIYQETRRIVIAFHQYIIYYEYLPAMIGRQKMIDNKLIYPDADCYIKDYDQDVNPAISNEFAASAFRLSHSEIVGYLKSYMENRNVTSQIRLSDWFDRPSICEHANNYDGLTIGLATQPQSAVDRYMPIDILNLLFKDGLLGQDLKTIDIQRGRDHGLCSYAQTLRKLNISDPKSFQDFEKHIDPKKVDILRDLYDIFEDVDLTVGLSIEKLLKGTLSGPVTQALLIEQFKRTRVGDSCFFENGNGKCAFTCDQLKEIRKSTMASFLCYNKGIKKIQPKAFEQISEKNKLKLCSEIPTLDLRAWKEKKRNCPN